MTIWTFHRGHGIQARKDSKGVYSIWEYPDGTSIKNERPCPRCGNPATKEGHDHGISNLPEVKYACCGHGVEDGYVKLYNGKVIRFNTNYTREEIINLINQS